MNAFKPTDESTPQAHWNWRKELLNGLQRIPAAPSGQLIHVNDALMHFTDETGGKVYLVLHGTPPAESTEELLQAASAMEEALLNERANRFPGVV